MIRVAHVVVAGELGGAEHMLRSLAHDNGGGAAHWVAVFSPSTALVDFFRAGGLDAFDGGRTSESPFHSLLRPFDGGAARRLAEEFRARGADVVHLHTFQSQVLGTRAARLVGAPVVRTEHSTRVFDDPTCWPFSRWSLVRAQASVAVSAHVRDVLLSRAPFAADRVRTIHNGVDADRFAPPRGRTAEPFTFVLVGRLEPRKGVDRALRALALVPQARLELVGDGAIRGDLERLARELGIPSRVVFHGALADPRPVLHRAHATVAASRKEGLGIAFLEAMATGLPLAAVPVGGLVEIVRPGTTGILAREDNVEGLAVAMRELASSRERAQIMGLAARRDVIERFSTQRMRTAYGQLYERLAGGRGR